MHRLLLWTGLAAAALMVTPSRGMPADFSPRDGQVLGRTLGFVGNGITGPVTVGIIFQPTSAVSRAAAEKIMNVVGDGLPTGRVTLHGRLIPVSQLPEVSGISALYVTAELDGAMEVVTAAAQRLHVPTVSSDLACVRSGACVVGFSSEPTIQIIIDRNAAERTGVRFVQAFRMLVREQ